MKDFENDLKSSNTNNEFTRKLTRWEELAKKFENADFGNSLKRIEFLSAFELTSRDWWLQFIRCSYVETTLTAKEDFCLQLSRMWCSEINPNNTVEQNYNEARQNLSTALDMTIDRWLKIKMLLNTNVKYKNAKNC